MNGHLVGEHGVQGHAGQAWHGGHLGEGRDIAQAGQRVALPAGARNEKERQRFVQAERLGNARQRGEQPSLGLPPADQRQKEKEPSGAGDDRHHVARCPKGLEPPRGPRRRDGEGERRAARVLRPPPGGSGKAANSAAPMDGLTTRAQERAGRTAAAVRSGDH